MTYKTVRTQNSADLTN